jgi:hypothetical protein
MDNKIKTKKQFSAEIEAGTSKKTPHAGKNALNMQF